MPTRGQSSWVLLIAGLLICGCPDLHAGKPLPDASEVTRRLVERSRALAQADGPQYSYRKRSLLERMDPEGKTLKTEEKIYEVTLIASLPVNRLVKVEGRELSPEELARENAKEEKFRQRFISTDAKKLAARREGLVTPELLARYDFVVENRIVLSNRATLVLTFKPKAGTLPSTKLMDKLLNRMAGKLWIDEEDADTARVEVRLTEPFYLGWFGWLASLTQFELSLDRQRMPDGVWINAKQALLIQCRKMTTAMRFRITEESSEFRKITKGKPNS